MRLAIVRICAGVVLSLCALSCGGGHKTTTLECKTGDLRPCMCDAGGSGVRKCVDGVFAACACELEGDAGVDAGTATTKAALEGRVFDSSSSKPIAGVAVKSDSGESAVTGADGSFTMKAVSKPRSLALSRADIADSVAVPPSGGGYVEVFVKRVDARVVFDPQKGVVARTPSGSKVTIPPGTVRNEKNVEVDGPVTLELAEVNGKDRTGAATLPEPGKVVQKNGKAAKREAVGAINVTLRDDAGNELNVAPDGKVTADLKANESDPPLTRAAMSYDKKTGTWKQEDDAVRTVDDKGWPVFRIKLKHLSWWAYGDLVETTGCYDVCVLGPDGAPAANAQVWAVGASYTGVESAFTGADGCYEGTAPVGGELVLSAQANAQASEAKQIKLAKDAGAACVDAGKLMLAKAKSDQCPAGFDSCSGACVDTSSDIAHCGSCDKTCGSGMDATQCIAGVCGCPGDEQSCKGSAACVDVSRDRAACGTCGHACTAAQECVQGQCVAAQCPTGTTRCGADCVDLTDTTLHCGMCDVACADNEQCVKGLCLELTKPVPDGGVAMGCAPGFDECDGNLATVCETKLNTTQHCGSCDQTCTSSHGVTSCVSGACSVDSCDTGFDDCDGKADTGCETNLATTAAHCGSCQKACTVANGSPGCAGSQCTIASCNAGFDDCDHSAGNGCETDLHTLASCGACNVPCSVPHATASCASGTCAVGTCDVGFEDCDGLVSNGCETDTHTLAVCGACGVSCARENASVSCSTGSCQLVGCNGGFDDCDGDPKTGCEAPLTSDIANCGQCTHVCTVANGTPGCATSNCNIASCDSTHDDCDHSYGTGCETDLTTLTDCGKCGNGCSVANGAPSCLNGACGVASCDATHDDCDSKYSTGCETDLTTTSNCGKCGTSCSVTNGTPACTNAKCALKTCNAGFADCDTQLNNGCEVTLASDAQHCGSCSRNCQAAGASCSSGMCSVIPLYSGQPYGTDNSGARSFNFNGSAVFHVGFNGYTVDRLPVDGSGVVSVWAPSNKTAGQESVWATATDVFWAERGTPSVVLTKPHSAQPSDLPTIAWTPAFQPTYLQIQGSFWYWASGDYQSGDPGGFIYRRSVTAPSNDPGTQIVSVDQGTHGSILALTATSDALYWVTTGPSNYSFPYYLHTAPITGGTPTVIPIPTLNAASLSGRVVTLVPNGTTLYFNVTSASTSFFNGIYKFTSGDSTPTQLLSADGVSYFVMDQNFIYFQQSGAGGVWRTPLAGGSAVQVTSTGGTQLVGVDATYLYMTQSGCCSTSLVKVVK